VASTNEGKHVLPSNYAGIRAWPETGLSQAANQILQGRQAPHVQQDKANEIIRKFHFPFTFR
jgi:hypothetical protein